MHIEARGSLSSREAPRHGVIRSSLLARRTQRYPPPLPPTHTQQLKTTTCKRPIIAAVDDVTAQADCDWQPCYEAKQHCKDGCNTGAACEWMLWHNNPAHAVAHAMMNRQRSMLAARSAGAPLTDCFSTIPHPRSWRTRRCDAEVPYRLRAGVRGLPRRHRLPPVRQLLL